MLITFHFTILFRIMIENMYTFIWIVYEVMIFIERINVYIFIKLVYIIY